MHAHSTSIVGERAWVALVTGAGGFVAGALVTQLRANGWDVRPHLRCNGDLRKKSVWRNKLIGVTAVFHLAGLSSPIGPNGCEIR